MPDNQSTPSNIPPLPWRRGGRLVFDADERFIASVAPAPVETVHALADLFVAAPDLLAAALLTAGGNQTFALRNYSGSQSVVNRRGAGAPVAIKSRKNKCGVKQGRRRAIKAKNIQRNKAHH